MSEKKLYSWVQTHIELVKYLSIQENKQLQLINLLKSVGIRKVNDIGINGESIPLTEIDPFTFFRFIYKHTSPNRLKYLQKIAESTGVLVPSYDSGLPKANPLAVRVFPPKYERLNNEISRLWDFFFSITKNEITDEQFSDIINIKSMGEVVITEVLFYVDPENYLPINSPVKNYLKENYNINCKFNSFSEYEGLLEKIKAKDNRPFYEISAQAWVWNDNQKNNKYWIFQGNPDIFDFGKALKEDLINDWTVSAHKDKISVGDKVIIWITGKEAGCYALAEVTASPKTVTSSTDDHLWKVKNENQIKANIKITYNFIDDPILKKDIAGVEELKDLKAGNQGTNFSATKIEYEILKNMRIKMENKKYWLYAPGENAYMWEEFYNSGIMALGWDELGDLTQYGSQQEIEDKLLEEHPDKNRSYNDSRANFEFLNVMSVGDIVIVKKGRSKLLGYGVVTSDYYYDPQRDSYTSLRKINWIKKGEWDTDHSLVLKTLTDITNYPAEDSDYDTYYERLIAIMSEEKKMIDKNMSYYEELMKFLSQAKTSELKTSDYLKTYGGLNVKVSFGQGNVSKIPWIAFLNDIDRVQEGIYPVYLYYKENHLLILAYGISETNEPSRSWEIENGKTIQEYFDDKGIGKPARYGTSYVYKVYNTNMIDDKSIINEDLKELLNFYLSKNIKNVKPIIDISPSHTKNSISIPKPFLLLAGISGTGKTRFVKEQAKASAAKYNLKEGENYCLVPVRPDWHEPSDLLGYISRINGTRFITTKFLNFLVSALCESIDKIKNNKIIWRDLNNVAPYWLCLDEMNLAPVEQYFADYLSILETRKWENGQYFSHPILEKHLLDNLRNSDSPNSKYSNSLDLFYYDIFNKLEISEDKKESLKIYFNNNGIPLPPNLIVAGTVNMDETTHGFSRKVIDRALTLDFQEFFPNEFDEFFIKKSTPKMLTFPNFSEAYLTMDPDNVNVLMTISFMKELNSILINTPFELAYRALNEVLLSVECFQPSDKSELQAVWDDFLMQKVLPRIEGDTQKLSTNLVITDLSSPFVKEYGKGTVLHDLYNLLDKQLNEIWNDGRSDLLRDTDKKINCRSKKKLEWMMKRLKSGYFTDFWV